MATSSPYSNFANKLSTSRLSNASVDKNLGNRSMSTRGYIQTSFIETPIQPVKKSEDVINTTAVPETPKISLEKNNVFAQLILNKNKILKPISIAERPISKPLLKARINESPTSNIDDFNLSDFDIIDSLSNNSGTTFKPSKSSFSTAQKTSSSSSKLSVDYSDEQMAVIQCKDRLIVVDAFAGCGKTTTAVGYANFHAREKILYMCLNKANADEAQKRFGSNVTAATTHSVAWRAMNPNRDRITNRWKPILIMDQYKLRGARESMIAMKILSDFFNSSDSQISEKHAKVIAFEQDLDSSEISKGVTQACMIWSCMLDSTSKTQMPHDAYLKMFALRSPKLNYSTIIFDEAQDANPVTLQIINGQKDCKLLCIGDRHQSIYQFRGSVNAMEKLAVGSTHFHLSKTWRFGPKIAEIANLILGELKNETVKIQGLGKDGNWNNSNITNLSRTNAELFRIAAPMRGRGVHWVGGVDNYRMDMVLDAFHLYIRERTQIKDPIMKKKFTSWDEYSRYANDAHDSDAKVMVKVVEEFGYDIPNLIEDIQKNAILSSNDANLTLTTAHKSKGLDWDCVRISNDFEVLEDAENIIANSTGDEMPIQDINLLYVAITRAKKAIDLNNETAKWLENLPKHRNNREAANIRINATNPASMGMRNY